MKKKISIFGAGRQGKIVLDILNECPEYEVVCFKDEFSDLKEIEGIPVVKDDKAFAPNASVLAIARDLNTDLETKEKMASCLSVPAESIFHPSAVVSDKAEYGEGVICHHGTVVMRDTKLGSFSIISTGATIDHDNVIEDFVTIAPGVTTCGHVVVKKGAFVGAGATILPEVTIGERAIVGAGAVVLKDVEADSVVVGNPARRIK